MVLVTGHFIEYGLIEVVQLNMRLVECQGRAGREAERDEEIPPHPTSVRTHHNIQSSTQTAFQRFSSADSFGVWFFNIGSVLLNNPSMI